MTEEQRMEEGRRMFQIFAARMFEQRVLTAYKEKVARERQEKLLEELADETRLDAAREAKKAKEAQKKKDKKRQQKLAKEEEKAKKDREKAAEEEAARKIEEQRLEEQRQKKEEQRKKREAEKRAQDEERQRKEAEKQKKLQEAREQQAELERKQREQKDKEKKKKEEVKKKEREEREAKEREAREKKERENVERKEREAKAKAEREAKERAKKDEQISKQTTQIAVPVPIPPLLRKTTATAVPLPPGLHISQTQSNHASPHLQVATPVIPKAPTPMRPRQTSFQGSHSSSPKAVTALSGSSTTSPVSSQPPQQTPSLAPIQAKVSLPFSSSQQPQPLSGPLPAPPGLVPQPYSALNTPTMPSNGMPMHYGQMPPPGVHRGPFGHEAPMYPQYTGPQFRNFMAPNGLPFPPGINGMRAMPHGRGMPMDIPISQPPTGPGAIGSPAIGTHGMMHSTMPSHSRNASASASYEKISFEPPATSALTQPIARPVPIQRPSSLPRQGDDQRQSNQADVDDLSKHLGSSALLADSDEANSDINESRQANVAPGPRSGRLGFTASPMFPEPLGCKLMDSCFRTMLTSKQLQRWKIFLVESKAGQVTIGERRPCPLGLRYQTTSLGRMDLVRWA